MTGEEARSAKRIGAYSLGFLRQTSLRRCLKNAGYQIVPGPMARDLDGIAVWGDRPVARRALAASKRRGVPPVFVEDAFLRSVTPSESGPVIGLTIDHKAPYFDCSRPSNLEDLLNAAQPSAGLDDVFDQYLGSGLSKYNRWLPVPEELESGSFVLVADQKRDDASIRLGGAGPREFAQALEAALDENPGLPIYIKTHPRANWGHFDPANLPAGVSILPRGLDPVDCVKRAHQTYCVTSQLGFEDCLQGGTPRVFGVPFYAGWGLTGDEKPCARRQNTLDRGTLFRVVMQEYCRWFCPLDGAGVDLSSAMHGLSARRQHDNRARAVSVAVGMRPWKRRWVGKLFPSVAFAPPRLETIKRLHRPGTSVCCWANQVTPDLEAACRSRSIGVLRMEDGFLRSRGLGAALVPPGSVVLDGAGIYYDPSRPSDLETAICRAEEAPEKERARNLLAILRAGGMSKYNVGSNTFLRPTEARGRKCILVPGQVEDDASIIKGASDIRTNRALLQCARQENPDAFVIYKPHPDVEAGLRQGDVPPEHLSGNADLVIRDTDPIAAIMAVDAVWTMTSLIGFEALLRGREVVCLGQPFYSGWGLTTDRIAPPDRRNPVTLEALVQGALIDYPTYFDPGSGLALSVEQHLKRLSLGARYQRGAELDLWRLLQKLRRWI